MLNSVVYIAAKSELALVIRLGMQLWNAFTPISTDVKQFMRHAEEVPLLSAVNIDSSAIMGYFGCWSIRIY